MDNKEVNKCPNCGAELIEGKGIAQGYWHCPNCDYVEKEEK